MADNTLDPKASFDDIRAAFKADAPPTAEKVLTAPTGDKVAEPAAAEPVKTESKEVEHTENKSPESNEGEKAEKKPRRFSELTRKMRDAEAAAVAERERAEALARELEDLKAGKKPEAENPSDEGKPAAPDANKWTGTWQELEAAREKYTEDLAEWKANQKIKEAESKRTAEEAKKQAESRLKGWREQEDRILDEHGEAAQAALKEVGVVASKLGIIDVIRESEVGADIVMQLHADADALAKLAKMSPFSAAREIGRIEDRILARRTAPTRTPLPKPPQAIGGSATGSSAPIDVNKLSLGDLKTLVRGEVKRRR